MNLHSLTAGALAPILAEETALSWEAFRWQSGLADEDRRGIAWVQGERVLGYLALASNGQTVQIQRLFAAPGVAREAVEAALLQAAIRGAFSLPGIQRISGSLLTLSDGTRDWLLASWPGEVGLQSLMAVTGAGPGARASVPGWTIGTWQADLLAGLALAMERSYAASTQGPGRPPVLTCERAFHWLGQMVEHHECGRFEASASFVAQDALDGKLLGFSLCTRMGPDQGHVAQLAVVPEARNQGIGTALLARSLTALEGASCPSTHLVVDAGNQPALVLYHRLGFREVHRFPDLQLVRPNQKAGIS